MFENAVNSLFNRLGVQAVYTPNGGGAKNIRVIPKIPDEVFDVAKSHIHTETSVFDVRISDVTSPKAGDIITLNSVTYTLQGESTKDLHGIYWRVEAYAT